MRYMCTVCAPLRMDMILSMKVLLSDTKKRIVR